MTEGGAAEGRRAREEGGVDGGEVGAPSPSRSHGLQVGVLISGAAAG